MSIGQHSLNQSIVVVEAAAVQLYMCTMMQTCVAAAQASDTLLIHIIQLFSKLVLSVRE